MSNLLERLRSAANSNELRHEAADEIERLRAQLAIAGEHIAEMTDRLASARKALGAARERLQGDVDEMSPGWRSAVRLIEQIDLALTDENGKS